MSVICDFSEDIFLLALLFICFSLCLLVLLPASVVAGAGAG